MGEEVWPEEDVPFQLSPLVPCTAHEAALALVQEMAEVSPTWRSEGAALSVAESEAGGMHAPEAQPKLHVCMVAPVQLFTRSLPEQCGGVVH